MDQDSDLSYEQPLSPVLSSSSKRNIIKRKKKSSTTVIVDKIETNSQSSLGKIENIEAGKISQCNSKLVEQQVDSHTYEELKKTTHKPIETSVLGFQTASGKQIFSKELKSEDAKNLFGEILNPTLVTHRENKFNFLSRRSRLSDNNSVISRDFLGFDEYECIQSKEKFNYVKYLHGILSCHSSMNYTKKNHSNKKRKLCFEGQTMNDSNSNPKTISEVHKSKSSSIDHKLINGTSYSNIYQQERVKSEEIQMSRSSIQGVNEMSILPSVVDDSFMQDTGKVRNLSANNVQHEEHTNYSNLRIEDPNNRIGQMKTMNGFSTASGKNIEISAKSFSKINNMFKDISEDKFEQMNIAKLEVQKNEILDSNIRKTEVDVIPKLNLELPVDLEELVKEQSIELKHQRFSTTCKYPGTPLSGLAKFTELCKRNFKTKESSESSNMHCKSSVPKFNDQLESVEIKGFSTASGNAIQIPAASLARINNLFKDIPDLNTDPITSNTPEINHSDLKINKSQGEINIVEGFSTASGNQIKIPASSLSKVGKIFGDISDMNLQTLTPNDDIDPYDSKLIKCRDEGNILKNFSTASGNQIKIPASTLSKLGKIFGDIPNTNLQKLTANVETVAEDDNVTQYNASVNEGAGQGNITPIRPIPRKKTLGSSYSSNRKACDTTMNRVKCLFSDMNFDDLKLPGYSKASPRVLCSTPLRPNDSVSTPHFPKTFIPTPHAKKSFTNKNGSFLNDIPQEYNCPFLIQKPTSGDLKSWAEDLARQKILLETKLSLVSKRYEAISAQMEANSGTENSKPQCIKKKINKILLRDVAELEIQHDKVENINNVILQINPQNAALVHFNGNWSDVATITTDNGCTLIPNQQGLIGLSEIGAALESSPHIKKHLIPDGWIKNHYKWIIWKLASYERYFPSALGGSFTIDNVMKQLQYRYNREIFNVERPALRKIYEMDDVSQKRMILCISNIFKNGDTIDLELTDGWYSIRTIIDDLLCTQVNKRKIRIGSKLIISGADLLNCDGCHPLETEQASKVRLKIYYNSTRRVKWFCKLGYQKNPRPLLINLNSAHPAGGIIGAVKVYIVRVYPLVYMEKINNTNIWRNQNAEHKKTQSFENACYNEYEDGIVTNEFKKRNVLPILQMTVVNAFGNRSQPFKCTIWNPTDFHAEQLKENKIIFLYNLTLRSKNELSCNMKTRFDNSNEDVSKYEDLRRKYVPLSNISSMLINSDFKEFDTVGFIFEICVGKHNQYFWLTDLYNLLLVEINESPENCLLLNRMQEDQLVAVCNVSFINEFNGYSLAKADFHSILTNYPQHSFLRNELMKLGQMNKTDVNTMLKNCKTKVNNINGEKHSNASEGNVLHSSQVTSTDIAMSMINLDEVINNTK